MLRSFRLKLTLMATCTSALVVVIFGAVVWTSLSRAGLQRLDDEIRAVAVHFMEMGPLPPDDAAGHTGAAFLLGDELQHTAFAVQDREGALVFRSAGWPPLPADALPLDRSAIPRCAQSHRVRVRGAGLHGGGGGAHRPPAWVHAVGGESHHRSHVTPILTCACGRSSFSSASLPTGDWRVGAVPDGPKTLLVAVNLDRFHAHTRQFHGRFAWALAAALVVSSCGGFWLAHRALRPLDDLTRAAEQITAASLERRIPTQGADREFARLIEVLNAMLERLQRSYQQAVRFSADASHELKTPLQIMQGEVEAALSTVPEGSPAQQALVSQLEEVQRLSGMVHKLLLLSRADAGTLRPRLAALDLVRCVEEVCEDSQALAPDLRFTLELPTSLTLQADPSLAPLVVQNLVANATRYNAPAGQVRVSLVKEGERAALRVSNTGPAIEAEARSHLFERFYRGDLARGREQGVGLGLSLAREFARAHGGDVSLESSADGWNTFCLVLPLGGESGQTRPESRT